MKDFAIQLTDTNDQGNFLDIKIDPIVDSDGKIVQGLVLGDTKQQNMALILMSNIGEFKQHPTIGVGLGDATLDDNNDMLSYRHDIRRNFAAEGLKIEKLDLYNLEDVQIEANYE